MSVLGAFHFNTASTASGSGLTPCLSSLLPRYLIESLRISHFNGLHFKPVLSSTATKDLNESINVVFQGGCCYDHVFHVTHHKVPVLFRYSGQNLSYQSLKSRRGFAKAKGYPPPLVQTQFTCESGLFSVSIPQTDLPVGRASVQCGEELSVAKLREALVYSRYQVRICYCHCVQVTKVATKAKLPPFFWP